MKTKIFLFFLLFITAIPFPGCLSSGKTMPMRIGGKLIEVELADTPELRKKGLQGRKSLPGDNGMLFVFPVSQQLSFWSKDTFIPLSVAFIDDEGKIVEIVSLQPESTQSVVSSQPSRYALEMNSGWFKENGIGIGDRLRFEN